MYSFGGLIFFWRRMPTTRHHVKDRSSLAQKRLWKSSVRCLNSLYYFCSCRFQLVSFVLCHVNKTAGSRKITLWNTINCLCVVCVFICSVCWKCSHPSWGLRRQFWHLEALGTPKTSLMVGSTSKQAVGPSNWGAVSLWIRGSQYGFQSARSYCVFRGSGAPEFSTSV